MGVHQRLIHPAAQGAASHGGLGFVHDPQKTSVALSLPHGLRQLQIAAGSQIQLHKLTGGVVLQFLNMGQLGALIAAQNGQEPACRLHHGRFRQCICGAELCLQYRLTFGKVKTLGGGGIDAAAEFQLQCASEVLIVCGRTAEEYFGRFKAAHFIEKLLGAAAGCGDKQACGDVTQTQAEVLALAVGAGKEIVAFFVEHGAFGHRAGSDHSGDLPLDKALGQRRVFRLLTDGDLIPFGNQSCDVALGGMIGDAAHRGAFGLGLVAVAGGQGQIQLFGGDLRIFMEHFVEIAQTEEQERSRGLAFDLKILLHHGCQFRHGMMLLSVANAEFIMQNAE